jgi:two-component system, chemotaxis family, protein-glutamate methylesterase/glutaminase
MNALDATRVLVCEDSPSYALSLTRFLTHDGDLNVVGSCASGEEAIDAVERLAPDLVTMDLELPGMDGLEVIERLMREHPLPIVVVSAQAKRGSARAAAALAAGAVEALNKAQLRLAESDTAAAVVLRRRLRRLAHAHVTRHVDGARKTYPPLGERGTTRASVVAVAASTGGPSALATVLAGLPSDFPLPVLVAQHMTNGFIDALVRWLDERVPLPTAVARDGMRIEPGIWFAPDDAHLVMQSSTRLATVRELSPEARHPSADVLLESVAATAGDGALGVVLTGMGRDGGRGVAAIYRAGGRAIAQDEETSVVFGMPKTAIERGADIVLPLDAIASAVRELSPSKAAS